MDSTGIPKSIWNSIVGEAPFKTITSVVGVSLFVLIVSQMLGNVAVVQLAKPNVEVLGDDAKAYAWAVISFVATVGGNLTITGSAANIIVAEKVARLDPNSSLDFFRHYKVCFWVTLFCCALGAAIITAEFQLERLLF
jgi:Na+/H+ antiporter NhaD/arsenite permease-like protein